MVRKLEARELEDVRSLLHPGWLTDHYEPWHEHLDLTLRTADQGLEGVRLEPALYDYLTLERQDLWSRSRMTKDIRPEGLLTFWSLPEDLTSDNAERSIRPALGPWPRASLPEPRGPEQALTRAVKIFCREGRETNFRAGTAWVARKSLKSPRSWCFVEESSDGTDNKYEVLFSASTVQLSDLNTELRMEEGSMLRHNAKPAQLHALYTKMLKTICPSAIGAWLARRAEDLGGVSLRPAGGIYWMPPSGCDAWCGLCDAVEAAYDRGASMYRIKHQLDAPTARGVVERVRGMLNEELDSLEGRVFNNGGEAPSKRTVNSVNARLDEMMSDVEEYEACLEAALGDVRARVEKARQTRAVGEMLIASGAAA